MIHSSTGVKPCQILFGREFSQEFISAADGEESKICVLASRLRVEVGENEEQEESLGVIDDENVEESWPRDIKKAQKQAIEVARDHLLSRDMKHKLKAPTRLDHFEVSEYVLVEQGSSFR